MFIRVTRIDVTYYTYNILLYISDTRHFSGECYFILLLIFIYFFDKLYTNTVSVVNTRGPDVSRSHQSSGRTPAEFSIKTTFNIIYYYFGFVLFMTYTLTHRILVFPLNVERWTFPIRLKEHDLYIIMIGHYTNVVNYN